MRIKERREHRGDWWGRDANGTWYRWNSASSGWDGPLAPPWPPAEPVHPDEAAIVAAAMAAGAETARALGEEPPTSGGRSVGQMNRVDAWWNRHFPPFSIRRLLFGLAALPVIAGLQELLWVAGGRDPSLARYLFVCIAGGGLLATAWLPGMRELAERMKASGALNPRPMWPWRRTRTAPPPPPTPVRVNFGRDFLVALPFTCVMMLVMSVTVVGVDETLAPPGLLTNAAAALFSAALLALRASVWSVVVVSVASGVLGGLAMVFLSLTTFSEPGLGGFLLGWGVGAVLAFVFLYPMWRRMRDLEARGFRIPLWILMLGSVILVSGAALLFVVER